MEYESLQKLEKKHERNKLFTELLLVNIISTTLAVVGFIGLVVVNEGFSGQWALYAACGLSIAFNYLNIDWMYQGLEEYGYITGRSLLIKGLSFGIIFICENKGRLCNICAYI